MGFPPQLQQSDVQVLPDPVRGWLQRNPKRPNYRGFFPATDQQGSALDCQADILLLGGAAGSLKTSTILIDLIQERDYSRMNSYFFRKTYPELEDAIQQAYEFFPQTGGTYNSSEHTWRWPSGATFRFRHLEHEKHLYANQGKQMSAIGIDESTHLPMEWIRYLITRNRSTDPRIRTRVRLGTNPGNISHKEHKKMFFNGVCPHCQPDKAPPQGTLLWGREWHDGTPLEDKDAGIKFSLAYILSYVRDHNLLGPAYAAKLKMQRPSTAKALLEGCWEIFEGQYFDVWNEKTMVVPARELQDRAQWWWPRWVSTDYGFTISIGAAHLFIHEPKSEAFPNGRTFIADEFGEQETAANFAECLVKRWVLGEDGRPIERRWMPWFLSPDSFREIGVGFTLASQMNAVLQRYGLLFQRADNDRQGGAMKMYTGFERGELLIADNCKHTIDAISTRIHDPKEENDVFKEKGKEEDDYYDSARYGYKSRETVREVPKPKDVRIAEELGDLIRTNPTAAMVKYSQMEERERAHSAIPTYGNSARQRLIDREKRR